VYRLPAVAGMITWHVARDNVQTCKCQLITTRNRLSSFSEQEAN